MPNAYYIHFQEDSCSASTYSTKYRVIYFLLRSFLGPISTSLQSSINALRFRVFWTGSGSGDTWLCSCCLGLGGDRFWTPTWFNGVVGWFSCVLASSVSNPDPDSELEPLDPSPVVLVAQLAFWAAVILPRLFSKATALVN
jgi:hypothetical protein